MIFIIDGEKKIRKISIMAGCSGPGSRNNVNEYLDTTARVLKEGSGDPTPITSHTKASTSYLEPSPEIMLGSTR